MARFRAVHMDRLRGPLGIRRMDREPNMQRDKGCGLKDYSKCSLMVWAY